MSAYKILKHLFFPHDSNNQKAKILHTESLAILIIFFIGFQFTLNFLPKSFPSVLGYAANISPSEIIGLTNNERVKKGLNPLTENRILDTAALAKGNDMLAKSYWAHFAPDGTSPWSFFIKFGYKYQYAGENLARDYTNAGGVVEAWMNSPSHKENILNPHYREIGIGVVEGSLGGNDTTIVVQFFGAPLVGVPSIPIAKAQDIAKEVSLTDIPITVTASPEASSMELESTKTAQTKISPFKWTKNLSLGVVGMLLLVLSIDLIVVKKQRIARIGGRTLAHIAYLSMILAVILLLRAGQII